MSHNCMLMRGQVATKEYSCDGKWMVDSRLYTTSGQDSLLQRLNDAEYQIETTLNRIRQIVSEGL